MKRSFTLIILFATAISCHGLSHGQDATTYVEAFNVPVFESIDQNGVDLITGSLRITTPILESGSEHYKQVRGLQWTGKGWMMVGQPTIWRDGDKYIVNYDGKSEEFNDRNSHRRPADAQDHHAEPRDRCRTLTAPVAIYDQRQPAEMDII